jgi:preprotein translocase SecE subunit
VRQQAAERYVRELVAEMRRVTWPTRPEWVSATVLTIGLVIVIGTYTYLADELFNFLFGLVQHH